MTVLKLDIRMIQWFLWKNQKNVGRIYLLLQDFLFEKSTLEIENSQIKYIWLSVILLNLSFDEILFINIVWLTLEQLKWWISYFLFYDIENMKMFLTKLIL